MIPSVPSEGGVATINLTRNGKVWAVGSEFPSRRIYWGRRDFGRGEVVPGKNWARSTTHTMLTLTQPAAGGKMMSKVKKRVSMGRNAKTSQKGGKEL